MNEIQTLQGHMNSVNTISFSPDGKYLASGSSDKTVKIWDMELKTEIITLKNHLLKVNSVAFSPDGDYFISASDDRSIKLWNI
jgi:WD40 repeat protein